MIYLREEKFLIKSSTGYDLHSILFLSTDNTRSDSILIMCHGFTGDKFEWGRFPQMAKRCNEEGYDVLIFDFTGSGENKRVPITLSKQVQDVDSVYKWVKNEGYKAIAVLGLSLGGRTILGGNFPGIKAYVFWAPFIFMHTSGERDENFKDLQKGPVKIPSGEDGYVLIDVSFITDFAKFRIKPPLKKLNTPTLMVQGTADDSVPYEYTRKAFQMLPENENNKLVEIQDATHDFDGDYLTEFIENTVNWLKNYL